MPGIATSRPASTRAQQVVAETANWNTQVQGAGADLPAIRSWPMQIGAFFTEQDVARAAKVAVLGSVARDQLFGAGTDPTGATVRIKNQPFRVVGVLTSKGQAAMGPDQDDTVVVPYTTVQKKLLGITHLQNITISAADGVPFAGRVGADHDAAARAPQARRRAQTTTSRSARSRRWPPC